LVFSDELRNAWNSNTFLVNNAFIGPFQLWIFHLRKNDPRRTFSLVRKILTEQGEEPHKLFPDNFAREEIIQLGNWLIEQKRHEDAIWLIDKFIEDPDPEEPEGYRGASELNYHERIVKGEDPNIITTVLGYLAWVVQKLALHQEHITVALTHTKKLLSHKNLYVKQQAIVPLIEIAARRQWLEGYGKRPYQGTYKEFHKAVFDLVELVKDHPDYKALAKLLSYVFVHYKDLTTEEARQVLDALKTTDESAALFIYFGIFRQRHFSDQDIAFNGEEIRRKLVNIITAKREEYKTLHAGIVWHFWKILNENRKEFDTLRPYVDLFLKQTYQRELYCNIELIIKDLIEDRPDVCIRWFEQLLDQLSRFIDSKKQLNIRGGLWLVSTEEVMMAVAKHRPNELTKLMEKLVYLWKKGVFVGSPKRLFETFGLVSDYNQKTEIKGKFQEWYNLMKKLNPKLEKVNWQ